MQFEGNLDLSQPLEQVWSRLSDVRFLVQCIPGAEKVSESAETRAVCVLRPGFAFVRGTLELTIDCTSSDPDQKRASYQMVSKGIGSSSEVVAKLTFAENEGSTRVHWQAELQKLGGLLKAVPPGLIRGAAQKTINDVLANVQSKMAEETNR